MANLGSLWYQLGIKDMTDTDLQKIQQKLENLGFKIDVAKLRQQIEAGIGATPFNATVTFGNARADLESIFLDKTYGVNAEVIASKLLSSIKDALNNWSADANILPNKKALRKAVSDALLSAGFEINISKVKGLTATINNALGTAHTLKVAVDPNKLAASIERAAKSYAGKDVAVEAKEKVLLASIRSALKSEKFPIKVIVDKAKAQDAVRQALQAAGLQSQGFTASDKRAWDAQSRRMEAQARAAAQAALAQRRLASSHTAAQRATESHLRSSVSLGAAMHGNIRIAGELGPMLASAYSVVALKNFLQKVVEIGGELEQQKLAMKAILGDEGMANAISSQINTLAVKSPFGVMELNQYAKQLTAFQIPYNELYDTMKRMADVSAAVGVDMGRIILAYGQVRAAKFLKGTELRQFTEANIPMIDMLAKRFTKLKGEMVSAGDIMDMISKKEISFEDVKAVLWELTGEGGQFYNMQEVLSESVKTKWKNLADAVDLMFADIAKEASGPLKGLAELLTDLTHKWSLLASNITAGALAFGAAKVALFFVNRGLADSTLNAVNAAQKQALLERRNLRLAQSYRTLTAAEQATLNASSQSIFSSWVPGGLSSKIKSLTDEQTKQLILSQKIKKEEWFRLAAMDKLTGRQKAMLVVYGGISRHELNSIRNLKGMQLAVAKISFGLKGVGRALAGFFLNPMTVMMAAVSAAVSLWQNNSEELERASEFAKNFKIAGAEAAKNISKALESIPKNPTGVEAQQTLEQLRQLVRDYSSIPDKVLDLSQFKDDGTIRNTAEQIKYLKEQLENLQRVNEVKAKHGDVFSSVINSTNGGLFNDDVITNINDWAKRLAKSNGTYMRFVMENEDAVEEAIDAAAKEDAAFAKAIARKESLFDKVTELMNNYTKYSKAYKVVFDSLGPVKFTGGWFNWFWGGSAFGPNVGEASYLTGDAYNTMVDDLETAVKAFKKRFSNYDWENMRFTDAQEELIRSFFNGLIQAAEEAGPEVQAKLQEIVYNILHFDISGMSGELTIVNAMKDNLPGLLGVELANKVVNGLTLTPDEQARVNHAIFTTYQGIFQNSSELARRALTAAVSSDNKTTDLTKMAGIRARLDETAGWEPWKRELNRRFDGEAKTWLQGAADHASFVKAVQDGYDEANKAMKVLKPLMLKAQIKFDGDGVTSDYQSLDANQKAMVDKYKSLDKTKDLADKIAKSLGFNPQPEKGRGSQKDAVAESMRQRFKDIKDAWSEFQKWSKTEGAKSAAARIGESGLFSTLSKDKIPQTVEQYRVLIVELENELRKAGVKGTARESLLNDLLKQLLDIDKTLVDRQLKLALDKVSKEAERQIADYNLFDKIRKATGNQNLAMSVAFGLDVEAVTDYPTMIKQQLQKTVAAAETALSKGATPYEVQGYDYDKLKELYDARDTDQGMQAWLDVPEEIRKAWEKANGDILKYFDQQRDAVANILNEYQTLQDKIDAINAKRDQDIATVNRKKRDDKGNETSEYVIKDPDERKRYEGLINAKADWEIFQKSNDYLSFFNNIYGLTLQKAQQIGDAIQMHLNDQLQRGLITIYEYEQQMEKVRKQLDAMRNVKSDAMTFLTGGMKGLNQKKLQKAEGELANNEDYQKALAEQVRAQNTLNKAKEEGDEKAIETAEAQLALASQSVQAFTKIRDAIIADQEKMQNVLDVANIASNIANGMSDAFNTLRDMADSFGFDTESNAWETAAAVMDTLTTVTGGVQKVAQSAMSGDIGGMISGVFDTLLTPITIWNKLHDKKLQRDIELSKRRFDQYDRLVTAIERKLNDHLGGYVDFDPMPGTEYGADGAFGYMRDQKKAQLEELKRQQADMEAMKKKDPEALEEIKVQIGELSDEIANLEIEAANALYGIDIKGYAETIGDALWDAFMKGEDAAEAFDKAVADIMSNVVKNILKVNVLERAFQRTKDWLASENGPMSDGILNENEARELWQRLMEDGKKGMDSWNAAMDAMPEDMKQFLQDNYDGDSKRSGLSAGIQSVTEDTADLLASYVNAIRASVAMNETRWERLLGEAMPQIGAIAESQLKMQQQIAANTLRNAIAAEAIVKSNDEINRLLARVTQGASKFYVH